MTGSLLFLFLILVCPGHGGRGSHHPATINGDHGDAPSMDDLRRRRADLDREIAAGERVEAP